MLSAVSLVHMRSLSTEARALAVGAQSPDRFLKLADSIDLLAEAAYRSDPDIKRTFYRWWWTQLARVADVLEWAGFNVSGLRRRVAQSLESTISSPFPIST